MNWQHLSTLLWVRWRLQVNHVRRHGVVNLVIMSIFCAMALIGSVIGFFAAAIAGYFLLPQAPLEVTGYICDAWILGFLFFWMIGVATDLQRGEMLSIDKLLHLPTTLTEVYLFNFLSSLLSLTTLTFVPPMVGLIVAMTLTYGPSSLVTLPLLAGFVLLVCAVTYQFRGWLATLMEDKRKRQTVVVMVTAFIVLGAQAPQLINVVFWQHIGAGGGNDTSKLVLGQQQLLTRLNAQEISPDEYQRLHQELQQNWQAERDARFASTLKQVHRIMDIVNLSIPLGWLAYGAQRATADNPWPGLAGALGLVGLAALSLRRSYVTTKRYFTGEYSGKVPTETAVSVAKASLNSVPPATGNMVEWSLPGFSEPVAAIAWSTLRGLTRAPEAKLMLLSPLILLLMFGGATFMTRGKANVPDVVRSFIPYAMLGLSMAGLAQISQNQFGGDRSGFRAYVLSGVSRRAVLLGKNLALAPVVLLLAVPSLVAAQCLLPAPWTHFLGAVALLPSVFLVLCMLGNVASIVAPIGRASGSMQPTNFKGVTALIQFVLTMLSLWVIGLTILIPIGLDVLLQYLQILPPIVPLALILALMELAVCVVLYRSVIASQGAWLQAKEGRVLEAVVERGE